MSDNSEPSGATGPTPQDTPGTPEQGENAKSALPKEEQALWDFFISVGLRGAADLRRELGVHENEFRVLAPQLHAHPG